MGNDLLDLTLCRRFQLIGNGFSCCVRKLSDYKSVGNECIADDNIDVTGRFQIAYRIDIDELCSDSSIFLSRYRIDIWRWSNSWALSRQWNRSVKNKRVRKLQSR